MRKYRIRFVEKKIDESGKYVVGVMIGDNFYKVEVLKSDYDMVLEK
jgi:hypothetical protein